MNTPTMRAKMTVSTVVTNQPEPSFGFEGSEQITFNAVCRNDAYPEDGSDENNTYAKYSPSASLQITIANPALFGKIKQGDTFYVDFIDVEAVAFSAAIQSGPASTSEIHPFLSTGTNPPGVPSGLVRHDDGIWQHPTPEHEIVADKMLRQNLDVILQTVKSLPPSRERSLTRTKIEEAIMWLGMDLKRLGTPNPYPNSKDPSNTIVDATADELKL